MQKQKDRYPLFLELLTYQTAEEKLVVIAVERERRWQQMRDPAPNNGDAPAKLYVTWHRGRVLLSSVTGRSALFPDIPIIYSQ